MRRPPSPTPEMAERKAVTATILPHRTVCGVESLAVDRGCIRSTMPLRVGDKISIEIRALDDTMQTINARITKVEADQLLNDRAELQFLDVPAATRAWLGEVARSLPETEFESDDDDQVTHRRSVNDLSAALADLDPPTLRKR